MTEETVDQLKSNYDHLSKKLIMLENDLDTAYKKYKTKVDPNFIRDSEIKRIQKRINETRKQSEEVMSRLMLIYDDKTKNNDQSFKLFQTNNELIDTQNVTLDKNKQIIDDTSNKIQLNKRKAQIENYNASKSDRNINITIITLCFIVLSMIPIGLKFTDTINNKGLAIIMFILWATWGGILGYMLSQDINRTNDVWENRHFPLPSPPKTKDVKVQEEQQEEQHETISKIINAQKCH